MLTDAQIRQLADDYMHCSLSADEKCRSLQLLPLTRDQLQANLRELEQRLFETRQALTLFEENPINQDLHSLFLKQNCPDLSPDEPQRTTLDRELLKQDCEILRIEIERAKGNYANGYDDRVDPLQSVRIKEEKSAWRLSDLWESYKARKTDRKWNEKSAYRNVGLFTQLKDILGDCELTALEDEEKGNYLVAMLKKYPSNKEKFPAFAGKSFSPNMVEHTNFRPLSISAMNQCIILASSMMKFALENRKKWGVEFNPFVGLKLHDARTPSELRNVYSSADIKGLIEALKQENPITEPECFWIPLLGLFTGARLNDLCQLRVEDIQKIDGIIYMSIRHRPELNQKVKNKKDRTVPLHHILLELGFMDYVENQRHERLWPNLRLHRDEWGYEFSKRYNRTVRKRIMKAGGSKQIFHTLRHTFMNWYKQNLVVSFENVKVLKSIVGHLDNFDKHFVELTQDDLTFDRYGKAYKIQKQQELIEKLDYGIDFSSLRAALENDTRLVTPTKRGRRRKTVQE